MPAIPTVSLHDLSTLDAAARKNLTRRTEADLGPFLAKVKPIIAAVRDEGDKALSRFALELDKAKVPADAIKVRAEEFKGAEKGVSPEVRAAIAFAIENIRNFHEAQKPEEMWMKEVRPGVWAGDRCSPIDSVACYVPRGKGSFPSVLMMSTIPAKVAGVPKIALLTPPGPDGNVDAATLYACGLIGIEHVYKCGGAQAVAAAAFGTATVPKCLKILGPGSPWVVAAKRLLSDIIDPGIPAGPSEAIILADESADGRLAGLDLIIESEHGPDSSAFLVTPSRAVAEAARAAIPTYWAEMGALRVGFSSTTLSGPRGGIVLTRDMDEAIAFTNDYAPEHLQVLTRDPWATVGRLRNAGEILMGRHTPTTLGNYLLGPNAVLPTGGWARTASPLSVFDFMKRTSLAYVTEPAYPELARHAHALATYEGFDGHALAVSGVRDGLLKG
jgi:histidinol dehydrogenase